jgi:hypothetical protein
MKGGLNMLTAITSGVHKWWNPKNPTYIKAETVGFTGSKSEYKPCSLKKYTETLTHEEVLNWYAQQQIIQNKCRETEIKWEELTSDARKVEIDKQWSNLRNDIKLLFINADSDDERKYLLYNQRYLHIDTMKWANYTPDQKQLFITTDNSKNDVLRFLSSDRANEILENPLKWINMTDEEKKTYMIQHQYPGHKFDFETRTFDKKWFEQLTEKQQQTLQGFVKKNLVGSIQLFSSPIGFEYIDNPDSQEAVIAHKTYIGS